MSDLPATAVVSGPAGAPVPPPQTPAAQFTRAPEYADLPPASTGLPDMPGDPPSQWSVFAAAWKATTIKNPLFEVAAKKQRAAVLDIFDRLPADVQGNIRAPATSATGQSWDTFQTMTLSAAEAAAKAEPGKWGDVPYLTPEALHAHVYGQVKDDLAEAQAVLDRPGGEVAEFLGSGARAILDPANLVASVIGGPGGGSAWSLVLREALANGLVEGIDASAENAQAPLLDQPRTSILNRAIMGAALGGGLAGLVKVVPAAIRKTKAMLDARHASSLAITPPGGDALASDAMIDGAEATLRGEQSPAQTTQGPAGAPMTLGPLIARSALDALPGAEQLPYDEQAVIAQIIGIESGGRANAANPNSSAVGLGQFISSTWLDVIKRHMPELATGKSDAELLALRTDPTISAQATAFYTRDNAAILGERGLSADPGSLYLAHFMGPGSAVRALEAPLDTPIASLMTPKQIAANAGIRFRGKYFKDFTAGDLRAWSRARMKAAYDPTAGGGAAYTGPTTRGYTGSGEVSVADSYKIKVDYQVVDARTLTAASGDLQPRDRSRITSEAWIAEKAARLDPAQLMPAPTADRGTPIVGPDNIVESGNGRIALINRAYDMHPDRVQIYKQAIQAAGFEVPPEIQRPVLVARRTSDMTHAERVQFAIDAQDSGVAQMTPTELAQATSRALTPDAMARLDTTAKITDPANGDFLRDVLPRLSTSARNAMFTKGGELNAFGRRQMREAIFARAWPAADIIELFTEGDPGEFKGLLEALAQAAPEWVALRADIERGLVTPDMDISSHVLDAMRVIVSARTLAKGDRFSVAKALDELLASHDLLDGAVPALTADLVRKFYPEGRPASAEAIADFLSRYAADARKAGRTGGMFDQVGPQDVLKTLDPETFGNLTGPIAPARGFVPPESPPEVAPAAMGYDAGAAAPEAEAADQAAMDAFLTRPPDQPADGPNAADVQALQGFLDRLDPETAKLTVTIAGVGEVRLPDVLENLHRDNQIAAALRACAITPGGN